MRILIIICVLLAMPMDARAGWPESEWRKPAPNIEKPKRRHVHRSRPRVKAWKHKKRRGHGSHPAATVKAWRNLDGFADSKLCIAAVATVGDQANSTQGAQAQADKAWSQLVRYKAGERYMDLRFAKQKSYTCVHSSVPNVANRATAVVGIDTQFERCEIIATPCVPARGK